jgi:hypothetical protein
MQMLYQLIFSAIFVLGCTGLTLLVADESMFSIDNDMVKRPCIKLSCVCFAVGDRSLYFSDNVPGCGFV